MLRNDRLLALGMSLAMATGCGGTPVGLDALAEAVESGFASSLSAESPPEPDGAAAVDDPCAGFALEEPIAPPPQTNFYLPLSCRSFPAAVPVDEDALVAVAPFGCYGGGVWLQWEGMQGTGALPHELLLDGSAQVDCSAGDLQPVFDEAAAGDGLAGASVAIKLVESYQFDGAGGCVRGLYELVELRFAASSQRVFNGYAFTPIQQLSEAACDGFIGLATTSPNADRRGEAASNPSPEDE